MSRRRSSLVLLTVVSTALTACVVLVPLARTAPASAAEPDLGTSSPSASATADRSSDGRPADAGSGASGGAGADQTPAPSPLASALDPVATPFATSAPNPTPTATATATATATQAPAPTPEPATPAAAPPAAPDCAVLRCVALTFDDGPGPYTATLLDELAARGAPATFFLVGRNVARYPDLVAREVAAGHAIGNHSWDHADLTTLPPDAVAAELDQTAAAIAAAAGGATTLVRPPYGATNDQVRAALAARGDAAIFWSVDTEDWKNRDVAMTTQRALAGAAPGAIILMHDIHPTTVQALPGIVDQLRAAGYTLVTVPQLLGGALTAGSSHRHG